MKRHYSVSAIFTLLSFVFIFQANGRMLPQPMDCNTFDSLYAAFGNDIAATILHVLQDSSMTPCEIYACADSLGEGMTAIENILAYDAGPPLYKEYYLYQLSDLQTCLDIGVCDFFNILFNHNYNNPYIPDSFQAAWQTTLDLLTFTPSTVCDLYTCANSMGQGQAASDAIYDYWQYFESDSVPLELCEQSQSVLASLNNCVDPCYTLNTWFKVWLNPDTTSIWYSDTLQSVITAVREILMFTCYEPCEIYTCAENRGWGKEALRGVHEADLFVSAPYNNHLASADLCATSCEIYDAIHTNYSDSLLIRWGLHTPDSTESVASLTVDDMLTYTNYSPCEIYSCADSNDQVRTVTALINNGVLQQYLIDTCGIPCSIILSDTLTFLTPLNICQGDSISIFGNYQNTTGTYYDTISLGSCDSIISRQLIVNPPQIIPINPGWNMISSYVQPDNPDMADVFGDIDSNIYLVKDKAGETYIPLLGINLIGDWNVKQGYLVKAFVQTQLNMGCNVVDPQSTPISLNPGWNLIAYLRTSPMPIDQALSSITGNIYIVKDIEGNSYIPSFGINSIGNMMPGQGYKIKMANGAVLTYPAN